ncbi:MAG: hypothetical protein ACLRQF_09595 [Thomasclavelia ramosa]
MSSELYLGENTALDVVVTPDDATYQDASYTSSNEFVVVCKNNQMIAVGEGTATISANVNGQKITKEITVVKDNARKIAQELTSLTVENGRVDFPTVDGYSFSVFSSDLEKVIAKDGSVNLPIEDQEVALVVTVSKDGSEDSANTDEIKVTLKVAEINMSCWKNESKKSKKQTGQYINQVQLKHLKRNCRQSRKV